MLEVVGYICAIAVGLILGLLGAGGAILTVPILVYIFGVNPVTATGYSLFIVGSTTFIGSLSYFKKGLVNLKTSIVFAVPSLISMFITRKSIIPSVPDTLLSINGFDLTKDLAVMIIFAVFMLGSSYSMIRGGVKEEHTREVVHTKDLILIAFYGFGIGFVTGIVGAGGGFLIVPALVLLAKIPVKSAIGTSLLIITINSLSGFAGDLLGHYDVEWGFLLTFLAFAIGGILIGSYLSHKISAARLKTSFGWFVLAMGSYILIREIIATLN